MKNYRHKYYREVENGVVHLSYNYGHSFSDMYLACSSGLDMKAKFLLEIEELAPVPAKDEDSTVVTCLECLAQTVHHVG